MCYSVTMDSGVTRDGVGPFFTVTKVKTTRPIITSTAMIVDGDALFFGSARKWYAKECSPKRITWAKNAVDGKGANVWERCTPGALISM